MLPPATAVRFVGTVGGVVSLGAATTAVGEEAWELEPSTLVTVTTLTTV